MIQTRTALLPHGVSLQCRESGMPGRPVLVFLHGFPEGAFIWDELLLHFARPENGGYHCIAPYLRGFGESSSPPATAATTSALRRTTQRVVLGAGSESSVSGSPRGPMT